MKRGTPRHPKVMSLAAKLGVKRYSAVGLLEMLWHFTAEFALDGDIGKHEDVAIAEALSWDDDSMILVRSLVDAGWLDECGCHRLRVHDWNKHADQTVQRVLAKRKQGFLPCYDDPSTELAPSKMPLPLPKANTKERERARDRSKEGIIFDAIHEANDRLAESLKQESPFSDLIAQMSGLSKEFASELAQRWPDYPRIVETTIDLREVVSAIKGDWRPILDRVKVRFDPPYEKAGQDRLKKMLANWLEAERDGTFKRDAATVGKNGVPHQSEPTRPSLTSRLRRIADAVAHGTPLAEDWVDTWNEGIEDRNPWCDDAGMLKLIRDLESAGHVETDGRRRKIVDHCLPREPRTPKELISGPQIADPEEVRAMLGGLNWKKGR
jgi:hypothetical protein